MKILIASLLFLIIITGCKSKKNTGEETTIHSIPQKKAGDTPSGFFPVTSYLKGEILDLKNKGITPVKIITIGNISDTSWVKTDETNAVYAEFLSPVIDTSSLKNLFEEKKFLDLTLNAFTLTYDPVSQEGREFAFKHWDVYVNPDNGSIKRIYLVKKQVPDTELQLTWQSGKWAKIVTLKTIGDKTIIAREEKISFSYNQE